MEEQCENNEEKETEGKEFDDDQKDTLGEYYRGISRCDD